MIDILEVVVVIDVDVFLVDQVWIELECLVVEIVDYDQCYYQEDVLIIFDVVYDVLW